MYLSLNGTAFASGQKHSALVILANYKNFEFKYSRADFVDMLTKSGYDAFGARGCAAEYLREQIGDDVNIVVAGPVTLSRNREYYGTNNSEGVDKAAGEFVAEACRSVDKSVDFSKFDDDGDGFVDKVYVFYPGEDEAQCSGAHPEYMWAHSWTLKESDFRRTLTLDGVEINIYACSSEIFRKVTANGGEVEKRLSPIGMFCHEYAHELGLADMYDTDYDGISVTNAGLWGKTSIMDKGNYNDNGNTPPNFNAVELEQLHLLEPEELTVGEYVLAARGTISAFWSCSGSSAAETPSVVSALKVTNPADADEYFLLECRMDNGWDSFIGGRGMLVYHIDRSRVKTMMSSRYGEITSRDRWLKYNEVNCLCGKTSASHQCADLLEADGRDDVNPQKMYLDNIGGIFFPQWGARGIGGANVHRFRFWDGTESPLELAYVRQDGNAVRFSVYDAQHPRPSDEPLEADDMLSIVMRPCGSVSGGGDGGSSQACSLSLSHNAGVKVLKWSFNGTTVCDPSRFIPSGSGTLCAEVEWSDGSRDVLYRRVKK